MSDLPSSTRCFFEARSSTAGSSSGCIPTGIASLWQDGKLVPAARAIIDKGGRHFRRRSFRTGDAAKEARPTTNMKVGNLAYAGYFYGYNRALVAERVHDILTAVAFAKSDATKTKTIQLVGFEKAGPWVILARGLCGDAVARTAADLNGFRFEQVKDFDDEMMLPGASSTAGWSRWPASSLRMNCICTMPREPARRRFCSPPMKQRSNRRSFRGTKKNRMPLPW